MAGALACFGEGRGASPDPRPGSPAGPVAVAVPGLDAPFQGLETAPRREGEKGRASHPGRDGLAPGAPHRGGAAFVPALGKHSCRRARGGIAGVTAAFTRPAALPSAPLPDSSLSPAVGVSPRISRDGFMVGAQRRARSSQGTCVKHRNFPRPPDEGTPLPPLIMRAPPLCCHNVPMATAAITSVPEQQ